MMIYLKRKTKAKKPRSPIQFSKAMCLRSWWLMAIGAAVCLGGEFFLQYTARGSMREVVSVALSLITFSTAFINGGYITQNIFRDTSLNKNGIYVDEDHKSKHYIEKPIEKPSEGAEG
jgi:hypothetical protein